MSEFFLELFSEEIPASLQKNAREDILKNFKEFFQKKKINFEKNFSYSTPNRLIIFFDGIENQIEQKEEELRGPKADARPQALEGFMRSNNFAKNDIYEKQTEKGLFFFAKKPGTTIKTFDLLNENISAIIDKLKWKKSMKWSDFNLYWGRPLKSIFGVFDNKNLIFQHHHLKSSNYTYLDKDFESKTKVFKDFKSYLHFFQKSGVILNHITRRNLIENELKKTAKKKNLKTEINQKLLTEVTDLVDEPKVLSCKFDERFLEIPKEILIITMQFHQKYFHTLDSKNNITNNFLVVANLKDSKGLIKLGNERVINARLNDAEFFWKKNKSQNLLKQVSKLKSMNYFKGLGNYFDKVQRMRKLSGVISDELMISKDKIEISASVCKVDLLSDIVREFPEVQGIMGGHFASVQGFDKDIALAISQQYLPDSLESIVPKKPFSIALAVTDKIDTLVGFFGINEKPTSSKDPYALRRAALGIIRILIENNKEFKLKDLINYSSSLYEEQGFKFKNTSLFIDLNKFMLDRVKNYLKEKKIRLDIADAAINSYSINNVLKIFKKSNFLNKVINKQIGQDIIFVYKRASNILEQEMKNKEIELTNIADSALFKNEFEKNLYKKINDLRKHFTNSIKDENYEETLVNLASSKSVISDFFDHVIVNDQDKIIKKNRLELLKMLCTTFDNYLNFSKIESI